VKFKGDNVSIRF